MVAHFNKVFIEGCDLDVFRETKAYFVTEVLRPAFPDLAVTLHDLVAEADRIVTRKSCRGTHRGTFQGWAPTGRSVEFCVLDTIRIEDCRYVDHWAVADIVTQPEGK
ncbi:ester cyclase [Amycolatopsis sp. H20-H5]|uniref:ester cyclase n=1 Tax=Amycolatopsis sp. H20-H5 TaxID=3046309 RepID=UPI002DBE6703|nr:ester cyclase [Amycolatopsis sp. H20-H5]MEC3974438.1 ester cyclase [Amycolatopsis sp. H20-H5]